MTTNDNDNKIAEKVYITKKGGGKIIARGPSAISELNHGADYIEKHLLIARDSELIFERSLPSDTIILGNSHVNLGSDAQLEHVHLNNCYVDMKSGRVKNSTLIDSEYTPSDNPADDNVIDNYTITNSKIGGKTHLVNSSNEKQHHCENISAYNIAAHNSNLEGGLYTDCQLTQSLVKQPSTTWLAYSKLRHVAVVNPNANGEPDFMVEPQNFIEHSQLENSTIFNNGLVDLCMSNCKIANMVSVNGLLAEDSTIVGPEDKIILDNIDTTKNKLDFRQSPDSVTVRGLKIWRAMPPHYTSLKEKQDFATNDVHYSTRFHDAVLPPTVLANIDHLADTNVDHDKQAINTAEMSLRQALEQKEPTKNKTEDDSLSL